MTSLSDIHLYTIPEWELLYVVPEMEYFCRYDMYVNKELSEGMNIVRGMRLLNAWVEPNESEFAVALGEIDMSKPVKSFMFSGTCPACNQESNGFISGSGQLQIELPCACVSENIREEV